MIRWVVGERPEGGTHVAKFSDELTASSIDRIPQPAVFVCESTEKEIELEVGADLPRFGKPKPAPTQRRVFSEKKWSVLDRDGRVRFQGQPVSNSGWFLVKEGLDADGVKEFRLTAVDTWLHLMPQTAAQENAPNLEESERLMKEQKAKTKKEFSEYLKQKSRKAAEELGIEFPEEAPPESAKRKVLKIKRRPEAAQENFDGEWEGEQEFSDDDEKLFDDDANQNEELAVEVEDEDVLDKDDSVDQLFHDAFGDEILQIMNQEKQKQNIDDEALDDELKQFGGSGDDDNEEEDDEGDEEATRTVKPKLGRPSKPSTEPPIMARKTTKEDQIRARVKGMFWRNEYKLKLKDVLVQFPGLNRSSEDYQYLTRALKDLADVVDNVLHLKQQYRK